MRGTIAGLAPEGSPRRSRLDEAGGEPRL